MSEKIKIQMEANGANNREWKAGNPPSIYVPRSETFLEDCITGMKRYPDQWFDLAVVDPPYGINRSGQTESFTKNIKHKRKYFEKKDWDVAPPGIEYFTELFRVSKHQIIWGANYFTQYLSPSMGCIFWDKGQSLTMSDGELAYTSYKRPYAASLSTATNYELKEEPYTLHKSLSSFMIFAFSMQRQFKG